MCLCVRACMHTACSMLSCLNCFHLIGCDGKIPCHREQVSPSSFCHATGDGSTPYHREQVSPSSFCHATGDGSTPCHREQVSPSSFCHATGDGSTPCHSAAENGHGEAFHCLTTHGASTSLVNSKGLNPFEAAKMRGHPVLIGKAGQSILFDSESDTVQFLFYCLFVDATCMTSLSSRTYSKCNSRMLKFFDNVKHNNLG